MLPTLITPLLDSRVDPKIRGTIADGVLHVFSVALCQFSYRNSRVVLGSSEAPYHIQLVIIVTQQIGHLEAR